MKSLLLTILISSILSIVALSTNVTLASEIEDYLDELRYVELQLAAVTTDMYRYLRWFPDEKEWIRVASEKAIADLNEVKDHLVKLNLPDELVHLKDMKLQVIDKLQEIYKGIEKKKDEEIKQGFESFNKLYSQYQGELKEALKNYKHLEKLPDGFNLANEEVKLIQNQKDRDVYLNAIKLIKDKKYKEAYKDLNDLLNKYKDTPFEACIMLKISDSLLTTDSNVKEDGLEMLEEGIELLAKIIDKDSYSPVLYEAFYKWRTTEQYSNHGMSNMSEIPNKEYNQKRWKAVQTIKQYLKNNPDDVLAKAQVNLLLSLDNIRRGGPMSNDNLVHWGVLYVDLSKFESREPIEEQSGLMHLTNQGDRWSYKEVDILSINKSIKESAEELMKVGIVPRYIQYDVCLPANSREYRDLNKNVVVLVTALTHNEDELPLKRVYLNYSGEEISLQKISSKLSEAEDDTIREVFGNYREDSFYLLPMHFLTKDCELAADWAANRDGFKIGQYPSDVDADYYKEDKSPDEQNLDINIESLKKLLKREYSVVFDEDE